MKIFLLLMWAPLAAYALSLDELLASDLKQDHNYLI